jgi:hypothetical protein
MRGTGLPMETLMVGVTDIVAVYVHPAVVFSK